MKKFTFSLVLFSILCVPSYAVLVCLWGEFGYRQIKSNLNYPIGGYGHLFSRLEEVKSFGEVDILFLGSSHAYRGFDTRLFENAGYKSFNLGSGAQTHMHTELLLQRYLGRLKPKMVVYEVYPGTFCTDGVEASLDIIANDFNDTRSISLGLAQGHIKVINCLIFALYNEVTGKKKNFEEAKIKGVDEYISGGYVERTEGNYQPSKTKKNLKYWLYRIEQFNAFKRNLELLKKENIKVILVQAPVTKKHYESYLNNDLFDERISREGEYINFNKIMTLTDSLHFYDADHLNASGVREFNLKLIDEVFIQD